MGLKKNENQNAKSVIEQFENELYFCNNRYVARLLYKSNHENLSNKFQNTNRRLMSFSNKLKNDE